MTNIISFFSGEWIGVILDEPKGKNNGSVQKKGKIDYFDPFECIDRGTSDGTTVRYFTCNDNYGLYVRPNQIESVVNDLQADLTRSASSQSLKSQGSSTGSIPAPSATGVIKTSGLPSKQSGLKAPTSAKTPGRPWSFFERFFSCLR